MAKQNVLAKSQFTLVGAFTKYFDAIQRFNIQ